MPNFWSTTTQMIYEAFNGPRTVDIEFNAKVKELKDAVSEMKGINGLVQNLPKALEKYKMYCSILQKNLMQGYKANSIYFPSINDIITAHKNIEQNYNKLCNSLKNINTINDQWNILFKDANESLSKREEARSVYDHYDEKMEELVKSRFGKMKSGQTETK